MRVSDRELMLIGVLTLAGILYFGLTPKSLDRTNNAVVLPDESGVRFSPTGVALVDMLPVSGEYFSLDLMFLPSERPAPGFSIVAMFHGGSDTTQLIVGQWGSQIVVMNGDDYDHTRRVPRVTFDTAGLDGGSIRLTISTHRGRSEVLVNGRELQLPADLVLALPADGDGTTRLFLGNGVTGRQPWDGTLFAATLDIAASQDSADAQRRVLSIDSDTFAAAAAGRESVMAIPDRLPVFERRILAAGFGRWTRSRRVALDILINTLGFVPFGVVGYVIALRLAGAHHGRCVLLVMLCGCLLSLGMEVAQAWLPARHSSLFDLALNTLGATAGALVTSFGLRRLESKP